MATTPLVNQVAEQIIDYVNSVPQPKGMRLVERKLAEQFKVSRSPIRRALQLLETKGFVKPELKGGYSVRTINGTVPQIEIENDHSIEELTYKSISENLLSAELPRRITENELLRRYRVTKTQLKRILKQIEFEGWIEPLPGHGWQFIEVLTTMKAYKDSYRFRKVIEPAAIHDPSFRLNRRELTKRLEEQHELLRGRIFNITDTDIFELNSTLHETIIECSNNSFFISSLKRLNGLRRLMDYRQTLNKKSATERTKEHINIVELLLDNKRNDAAHALNLHLSRASEEKTRKKAFNKGFLE